MTKNITSKNELEQVNKQIYQQNLDLAIRNQTMSVLQKLYQVISTSYQVKLMAERITETIIKELNFLGGAIALYDQKDKSIKAISVFHNGVQTEGIKKIISQLNTLSIPVSQ